MVIQDATCWAAVRVWAADLRDLSGDPDTSALAGALCSAMDAWQNLVRRGSPACDCDVSCGTILRQLGRRGHFPPL